MLKQRGTGETQAVEAVRTHEGPAELFPTGDSDNEETVVSAPALVFWVFEIFRFISWGKPSDSQSSCSSSVTTVWV